MKSDITNLIIPEWDSRYGKLGHLFKRYNESNIILGKGPGRKYYIPKELVLRDKITHRGNKILRNPEIGDNYASANSFESLLIQSCDLTMQEYADLIIYHNNDKTKRPRCWNCGAFIQFDNHMNRCYGQFCDDSCSVIYWHQNSEAVRQHSIDNFSKFETHVKAEFSQLLNRGPREEKVSVYLVSTGTLPKFGVARDLAVRKSFSLLDGKNYKETLLEIRTTRYKAACIEAILKLDNEGSEWITPEEIDQYKLKIMDLLNKPTTNPFE